MIKLKKQSLQDLQKITASIKRNDLLPSLKYLKLDLVNGKNVITKSNLGLTCIAEIDGAYDKPYATILLDERILFAFLSEAQGDEVIIRIGAKEINLSDGNNSINLPREDPSNYPRVPEPIKDASYLLTKDHIGAIRIARRFANDTESAGNYQFVHISKNYIAAFNLYCFYINNKFEDLPEVLLTPEQADVVGSFDQDLMFEQSGNHYFFISPTVKYIFTKHEGATLPFTKLIENLQTEGKNFTMIKAEMVNFCSIANIVSESKLANCSLKGSSATPILFMSDADYNRQFQKDINVSGEFDEFNFDSRIMADPIRSIPYDIMNCKTTHNCFIVTGDKEWYCFIGMSKSN
jgi:hypothetical protein